MHIHSLGFVAPVALALIAPCLLADETSRISTALSGSAGSSASREAAISADGKVIAFSSGADDLVAGDTNGKEDVFVVDVAGSALTRVSVSSSGTQADGDSNSPVLSNDGRYVAFVSLASNLDADPNGTGQDIFLHDRILGTTRIVSMDEGGVGAQNPCWHPSISGDGQRIAFDCGSQLVAGDTNGKEDVYVIDLPTGTMLLASVDQSGGPGNGHSSGAFISNDGRVVAFQSSSTNFPNPVAGEGLWAVYAKDLATGALERVDVDSSGAAPPDGQNRATSISDDGALVAFNCDTALVPEDDNARSDAYLRDRGAGTTERLSVDPGGQDGRFSDGASISGDGRFAAFQSQSPDATRWDVYVRDRAHGTTLLASVGTYDEDGSPSFTAQFTAGSAISADGSAVVFESESTALVPGDSNGSRDVFLRTRSLIPATSSHYGSGFPGRNGVIPTMTPRSDPYRGSPLTIDVSNSSGAATAAYILVGVARDSTLTRLGGTLLVDTMVVVPFQLGPGGDPFQGDVPTDWLANGLVLDLQALQFDPWASKGVSFTDGLELVLGDG